MSRAAARDLYDFNNMIYFGLFDESEYELFRKYIIFYASISADKINKTFLLKLVQKYGTYFDPDIVSAKIYQEIEGVYFEYTKYEYIGGYLKNQSIYRIDLGFIIEDIDEEDKVFKKEVPIEAGMVLDLTLPTLKIM